MNKAIETLLSAQNKAITNKPKIGGFPYLAQTLKEAGVIRNIWTLPACQSIYYTQSGNIVQQGTPLINGSENITQFNQEALITAIRTDQAGESSFPEFLMAIWKAGVIWYEVDFEARTVRYGSANNETYIESYPPVNI